MPVSCTSKHTLEGDSKFDSLKKAYANGVELRGKTLEL
jgi:hypothetical protein